MGYPEGRAAFCPALAKNQVIVACTFRLFGVQKKEKIAGLHLSPVDCLVCLVCLVEHGSRVRRSRLANQTTGFVLLHSWKLPLPFVVTSPPLLHPTASLLEVATNLGLRNMRNVGNPDGADEERTRRTGLGESGRGVSTYHVFPASHSLGSHPVTQCSGLWRKVFHWMLHVRPPLLTSPQVTSRFPDCAQSPFPAGRLPTGNKTANSFVRSPHLSRGPHLRLLQSFPKQDTQDKSRRCIQPIPVPLVLARPRPSMFVLRLV